MKSFDPTKPVQTRDGRKARIICTDASLPYDDHTIVALITDQEGTEHLQSYTSSGRLWSDDYEDQLDLVNVPMQKWRWAYRDIISGSESVTLHHMTEVEFLTFLREHPSTSLLGIGRIQETFIEE